MAGEGSEEERGCAPLSNYLPLSNKEYFEHKSQGCLRGGLGEVSIKN